MRSRSILLPLIAIFIIIVDSRSQNNIPIGTWRTHFSSNSSTTLAITEDKIYSGSEQNLFYVDREYNSTVTQTKINGFAEVSVKKIGFSQSTNTLVIAYSNGNIDLVADGKIFNVPAIKNATGTLDKTVHHILVHSHIAFISTGLGLIVLDLNRREVIEAYQNIGENAESVKVFSSAFFKDYLYLATSEGLMYGNCNPAINLQDYNNWKTFGLESDLPSKGIDGIAAYNNNLYAGINGKGIFVLKGNKWTPTVFPVPTKLRSMAESKGKLLISQDSNLIEVEGEIVRTVSHHLIATPFEAAYDNENNLWIADSTNGLLKYNRSKVEAYISNGPYFAVANSLKFVNGDIIAFPTKASEATSAEIPSGFSKFSNGLWQNFRPLTGADVIIPELNSFTSVTFDYLASTWYYGSYSGILKQSEDKSFSIYDEKNSPLNTSVTIPDQVRILDLSVDSEGRLWVLNNDIASDLSPLHVKDQEEKWISFPIAHPFSNNLVQLLIDLSGQKWLRVNPKTENSGILVFDESLKKTIHLNKQAGHGELFNAQINDFDSDHNGYIWLATNNGVSVFYTPFDMVNNPSDATRPIFENQYLLKDTKVTSIAVDGGDRKWIGTASGGLWLFNDDVSELIYHFTQENSPLPSNNILDIAIHEASGEVFISTDKGMLSYRADASVNNEGTFSKVKVFPNPVSPSFKGTVGISGLTDNTTVKITDTSGKLIYQTISSGGTASWNLASRKIRSGVYFVFSVDENGEEALVSKVAVIE